MRCHHSHGWSDHRPLFAPSAMSDVVDRPSDPSSGRDEAQSGRWLPGILATIVVSGTVATVVGAIGTTLAQVNTALVTASAESAARQLTPSSGCGPAASR